MDLTALVPRAVGQDFNDAPPGHRYRLYLQFWNNDYSPTKKEKLKALRPICKLPDHSKKLMAALAERSKAPDSETTLSLHALSTAPFATGLGWEHPNENGFAFLDPYGLPYLAGSGVKGVLRQAARELANDPAGETAGWTDEAITALFGEEDPKKPHGQGALRFWDVIPELAGGTLDVDILNPHDGDYYQNGGTPHDAGQPVPVFFLIVPPNSRFHFRVDLIAPNRLDENLRKVWKALMQDAFEYAFDWLGFGAKTAVGYGAMRVDPHGLEALQAQAAAKAEHARQAAMTPEQLRIDELRQLYDRLKDAGEKQNITGSLYMKLRETTLSARDWPAEARQDLAELARDIIQYLDIRKNPKAKELLKSLDP
jgi:CRISPR-associated protein Cmr6